MWRSIVVVAWVARVCVGASLPQPHHQDSPYPSLHSSSSPCSSSSDPWCSRDALCTSYRDCCRDSQYYDETQPTRNLSVCIEHYEDTCDGVLCRKHTYMKATCSRDWNNTEVEMLCLKGNAIPDIVKGVPVQMKDRTYVNAYCAICNGEDPTRLHIWKSYIVCDVAAVTAASDDDYTGYDANNDSLPEHVFLPHIFTDYYENYTIMYNEGTWGVVPPGLSASAFIPCHTTFFNPANVYNHCEESLSTDTTPSPHTLTMRFSADFSRCAPRQVYDGMSSKCINITCTNPGEEFYHHRCVPVDGDSTQEHEPLCPFSHSCFVARDNKRGCSCDASCKVYGDCCHDSPYYDHAETIKNMDASVCVDDIMYEASGVYMRAKCSDTWHDGEVQALCLKGNKTPGDAKLFPVTSITTTITYVNSYCALCNGEDNNSLIVWYANIECSAPNGIRLEYTVYPPDSIGDHVQIVLHNDYYEDYNRNYNGYHHSYSYEDYGITDDEDHSITDNEDYSITGSGDYSITDNEDHSITGSGDYSITDNEDHSITGSGDYSITDNEDHSITGSGDYSITDNEDHSITGSGDDSITREDYSVIFHEGSWGIILPSRGLFPFTPCSLRFQIPEDVKMYTRPCEPRLVKTCPTSTPEHERVLCQSYAATVYHQGLPFRNQHCAACNGYRHYYCSTLGAFNCHITAPSISRSVSYFAQLLDMKGYSNVVGSRMVEYVAVEYIEPVPVEYIEYVAAEYIEPISVEYIEPVPVEYIEHVPVEDITIIIHAVTFSTPSAPSTPSTMTGFLESTNISMFRNISGDVNPSMSILPHHQKEVPPGGSVDTTPTTPNTAAAQTNSSHPLPTSGGNTSLPTTQDFQDCRNVMLSGAEFTTYTNGSLYVPAHGRTYQQGEYEAQEGGVLVCWSGHSARLRPKFSPTLGWVSVVGVSLSCCALVFHLTAFCLVPSLRKLSGKCLASLCMSLLAAYITVLLNLSAQSGLAGCVTLAAARYYFFLCYFTWMTTIAFDVWYTFRLTHTQLRVADGTKSRRFLLYSLCSWLLPAVCTAVLVAVDQLEPPSVPQGFLPFLGKPLCWISHRKALVVFFATPLAVFMIMNVVFFVSTAVVITKMSQNPAAAATPEAASKRRQRYWSFVRLAVLVGLTWITGLLAGGLDLEPLWYVFVVLNTLQGVFIFLAFTCRRQVLQGVSMRGHTLVQRGISFISRRAVPLTPTM